MSERPELHPDEALQELLDGRLSGDERAAVEDHLAGCVRCQRLRDSLLAARRLLRESATESVSPELAAALQRTIAEAAAAPPEEGGERPERRRARSWRLPASIAAVLLIALVGLVLRWRAAPSDPVGELLALHAGAVPVFVDREPAALEARFAAALPFRPRVLDLAAMDVHLAGGGTAHVGGSPAAWMLYTTPAGERLLCAMWRGRLAALPPADEGRERAPFTFRVYRRGALTVVAWQEGELVCAIVGGGDPEGVIALAMAKAMLPA